MQAASNVTLRAINHRLGKVEDAIKQRVAINVDNENNIVTPFLPLTTVTNIKQFDSMLKTSEESVAHFVSMNF